MNSYIAPTMPGLFGASLRLTPTGLALKFAPGKFLFSPSMDFTAARLTRKFVPDEFLFSPSMDFTAARLTRKFVPDEFFCVACIPLGKDAKNKV